MRPACRLHLRRINLFAESYRFLFIVTCLNKPGSVANEISALLHLQHPEQLFPMHYSYLCATPVRLTRIEVSGAERFSYSVGGPQWS